MTVDDSMSIAYTFFLFAIPFAMVMTAYFIPDFGGTYEDGVKITIFEKTYDGGSYIIFSDDGTLYTTNSPKVWSQLKIGNTYTVRRLTTVWGWKKIMPPVVEILP